MGATPSKLVAPDPPSISLSLLYESMMPKSMTRNLKERKKECVRKKGFVMGQYVYIIIICAQVHILDGIFIDTPTGDSNDGKIQRKKAIGLIVTLYHNHYQETRVHQSKL